MKNKYPQVFYPLVTSFLNESHVYEAWDRVFRSHGLTLKIAGVEKVILERFVKTGAKCPDSMNCEHIWVPVDALVQMNVIPAAK